LLRQATFLLAHIANSGPVPLRFCPLLSRISTELLVDSAVEVSPYVGIAVVTAAALNGIAVVRAYLLIFTGARHHSTVSLGIGDRERFAVLTFSALILGGGFFPQPGVSTRHRAAVTILAERRKWSGLSAPDSAALPDGRPEFGPARRHARRRQR
jgi:NADH-quinone oxidoreductase subunit M